MPAAQLAQCIGPSYALADRKSAVQRTINMRPMRIEGVGESAQFVLESAPGLSPHLHDFAAPIRGMHNADGRLFIVAGTSIYEYTTAGAVVVGSIAGAGPVSMVNSMDQLAVVNGLTMVVINLQTMVATTVLSAGWRGSNAVDALDGYFLFVAPDTEQFYVSAIDDALSLDALDFSSADSQPDKIIRQIVRKREAYFFGRRSCEVWINSGGADFPLARFQGTPIDVGIVGTWAVCRAADSLVWVGQTDTGGPKVYLMEGYQPVRISDQFIEEQLTASSDIGQAKCYSYHVAGAEFVAIDAPGLSSTLVWDASTRLWCERAELENGFYKRSRVEYVAYFNGKQYASAGSRLYLMSRDYATIAGDILPRERTFPHLVSASYEPVTYIGLELRCSTGDYEAGIVTLEVSNDGGATWGAPLLRRMGAVGRRQHRVRWLPLGTCPAGGSRVFRLRCTSNVGFTIQGAALL